MSNSLPDLLKLEKNVLLQLCTTINSPRSLSVKVLLESGEFLQLASLTINPDDYQDPGNFALDYLISSFLKKSLAIPTGVDRKDEALRRFKSGEELCRKTNERFMGIGPVEPAWLSKARSVIAAILGPLKSSDVEPNALLKRGKPLDRILDLARHGPGACVGLKGTGMVSSDKYDAIPTCTERLAPYARAIMGEPWWDANSNRGIRIVRGSTWTHVPKSAMTDRGIAAEPLINMFIQLGIGEYLVERLLKFGCDLHDQGWNQYLASVALELGLATIDLSNASDTLAWIVILLLFPPEWVELLLLCRCDFMKVDGQWVELEKLSSMGNGFTFPLETLVFLSVVYAIVPRGDQVLTGVYGDDIIVPQRNAPEVIQALEFLGFSTNTSKSFLGGEFFESCGADFFQARNVRPFYARGEPEDPVPYALHLANELRLYSTRLAAIDGVDGCSSLFKETWRWLIQQVPEPWNRCWGPPSYGDSVIICSDMESAIAYGKDRKVNSQYADRMGDGWEGFALRYCSITMDTLDKRTPGVLLSNLIDHTPIAFYGNDRYRNGAEYLYSSTPAMSLGREYRRKLFIGEKTRVGWSHDWPVQDWLPT